MAVWVVLVAEMFNSDEVFDVPVECADGGIDPNLHPHQRTGEFLKSKWTEVRALSVWLFFVCFSWRTRLVFGLAGRGGGTSGRGGDREGWGGDVREGGDREWGGDREGGGGQ